jgi:membrane protein YqaA with SNARE-associated domain
MRKKSVPIKDTVPYWHFHKRLYNWTIMHAQKKHATKFLFFHSFAESSFFPIPPDITLLIMSFANRAKSWWYAFICSVASVLGGLAGYLIGVLLYDSIGKLIINGLGLQQAFDVVGVYYSTNVFIYVLLAAFTPIPYKVFTIAAGFWRVDIIPFLLASIIGRSARFFIEAALVYYFGNHMKKFLDKYFNLITLVVGLLIVGGFIALKYL